MSSKVFFTDFRTKPNLNMLNKLERLVKAAGIEQIDFREKFTALKIHFGEPGNLAYIRPNYAAVIANIVRSIGGRPYFTDANTLYSGRRSNGVDHLKAAEENGYNSIATGCNVIIADGVKGTEYREIMINRKHCATAKIGSAIADADIFISLNHFKGHEMTGFGGAIKNIGMGSGSRGGKLEMHSTSHPRMNPESCVSCGICVKNCSQKAISFNAQRKAEINDELCIGCGQCVALCRYGAAQVVWDASSDVCSETIAEYALAVLRGKPHFHVSFIMDVSPNCDCWNLNDAPIIPDIGIAASFDPVALDKACVDMVNAADPLPGTALTDSGFENGDKFTCIHSNTNWKSGLLHAQEIGVGSMEYELVRV
jgi:uncharacterized Fe-S center protein